MATIFWICAILLVYSYFGYPVVLWGISTFRRRSIRRANILPTVSILMAARNEEANLAGKLANLRALDYPREQLQIIVVSDGSTDGTADILLRNDFVTPIILDTTVGKAAALNQAVRQAKGDILVFLDARQRVDLNAICELVANFADEEVGAVSGELMLEESGGKPSALGIYWKIEKSVRKFESASGSVIGVTGAIYAVRRQLYVEVPAGTILDDVFVPMQVIKQGKRVVFEPLATAYDSVFTERRREFSRKVRTLMGNYQLIHHHPWLIGLNNPVLFRYVSHKFVRLICPLLLIGLLVSSIFLDGIFYQCALGMQVLMYVFAGLSSALPLARKFRPIALTGTFVMLNAAAAVAFYKFITSRKVAW